jgi:DNA methylase
MLNENFSLRDLQYSTAEFSGVAPRHRWYVIKEAFAAKMVESAVEHSPCSANDLILDPFCGSGTVPVAASAKGSPSIGFEVNPFLAFVSRTKLLNCKGMSVSKNWSGVLRSAKKGMNSSLLGFSTFSERVDLDKWLFNSDVLRSFEGAWTETKKLRNPVRDLFRLALVGAAMDNCNAVADGKCLRYRKGWSSKNFGKQSFIESLEERIDFMADDLDSTHASSATANIVEGDSRKTLGKINGPKFKLCVTSPPYLNSFDYTDVYRPELFLSKFVKTPEELRQLRFRTLRSHVQVAWDTPERRSFGPIFDDTMQRMSNSSVKLWSAKVPDMIQAYFEDVERILLHLRRLAAQDASLWIVVSTSAYAGVEIPVDLIYAEVGQRTGWNLREVGVLRHLRSSGQHANTLQEDGRSAPRLRESVVILDAFSKKVRGN